MKKLLLICALLISFLTNYASEIIWTGTTSTNWHTGTNWQGGVVPGSSDVAVFNHTSFVDAVITSNISISGLRIESGYFGTVTQSGGSITIGVLGYNQSGGTFVGGSSAISVSGYFSIDSGFFTATSGALTLSSTIVNITGGVFSHNNGTIHKTGGGATWNITQTIKNLDINTQGNFDTTVLHVLGNVDARGWNVHHGIMEVEGNYTTYFTTQSTSSGKVIFKGSNNQVLSANGASGCVSSIEVNKTGGTLVVIDTIILRLDWTNISSGANVDVSAAEIIFAYENDVTSNGMVLNNITVSCPGWFKAVDKMTITGLAKFNSFNVVHGLIETSGNVLMTDVSQSTSSGTLKFIGSNNQSLSANGNYGVFPNIMIQKSGGVLTISDTIKLSLGLTWISGAVDASNATFVFYGGSQTIDAEGVNFGNVEINTGGNIFLARPLKVDGNLTVTAINAISGERVEVKGDFNYIDTFFWGNGVEAYLVGSNNQSISVAGTAGLRKSIYINKTGGVVSLASDLSLNNGWQNIYNISGTLDLNGFNLSLGGTLKNSGLITLIGSETITLGDLDNSGQGTVTYTGTGAYSSLALGDDYYHLNVAGTVTQDNQLSVLGDLNITGALNSNGHNLYLAGNFNNSGSYTSGANSVYLIGKHQIILGSNSFNNLIKRNNTSASLTFPAGSTQSISGTLELDGTAGDLLVLKSSVLGSTWTINHTGPLNFLSYLDVSDSNSVSTLDAKSNSVNGGNNTNWLFTSTNALVWNGAINNNFSNPGNWAGSVAPSANDIVEFLSGSSAVLIDVDANVSGIVLGSGFSGSVTLAANKTLSVGFNGITISGGSLVGNTKKITSSGNLAISNGLFNSVASDVEIIGSVQLSGGTLKSSTYSFKVGGNWTKTGGIFDALGSVTFNGFGGQTILAGGTDASSDFADVNVSFGTVTLANAIKVNGNLTINSGQLKNNSAIQLAGNLTNNGGFINDQTGSSWLLNGTVAQSIKLQNHVVKTIQISNTSNKVTFLDELNAIELIGNAGVSIFIENGKFVEVSKLTLNGTAAQPIGFKSNIAQQNAFVIVSGVQTLSFVDVRGIDGKYGPVLNGTNNCVDLGYNVNWAFPDNSDKPAVSFTPSSDIFENSVDISLASTGTTPVIYYTVDGSTPTTASSLYAGPFNIVATTLVKAISVDNGIASKVFAKVYTATQSAIAEGLVYPVKSYGLNAIIYLGDVRRFEGEAYHVGIDGLMNTQDDYRVPEYDKYIQWSCTQGTVEKIPETGGAIFTGNGSSNYYTMTLTLGPKSFTGCNNSMPVYESGYGDAMFSTPDNSIHPAPAPIEDFYQHCDSNLSAISLPSVGKPVRLKAVRHAKFYNLVPFSLGRSARMSGFNEIRVVSATRILLLNLTSETGGWFPFDLNSTGNYYRVGGDAGYIEKIIENNIVVGYKYRAPEGTVWIFKKVIGTNHYRLTEVIDRFGNRITYDYQSGNFLLITDASGNTYEVNANTVIGGVNLISSIIVRPFGSNLFRSYFYNYNAYGYLISQQLVDLSNPADDCTFTFGNDIHGNPNYFQSCDGCVKNIVYDDAWRVKSYTNSDGETITNTYSGKSGAYTVKVTNSNGQVSYFHRNQTPYRIVTTRYIDYFGLNHYYLYNNYGYMTQWRYQQIFNGPYFYNNYLYDSWYYLTQTIFDPSGLNQITNYGWNIYGNLLYQYNPYSNNITYGYPNNFTTTKTTVNSSGQIVITTYVYNSKGQLISESDNLGNTKSYQYDIFGNLITETKNNYVINQYFFDLWGRRASLDYYGNYSSYSFNGSQSTALDITSYLKSGSLTISSFTGFGDSYWYKITTGSLAKLKIYPSSTNEGNFYLNRINFLVKDSSGVNLSAKIKYDYNPISGQWEYIVHDMNNYNLANGTYYIMVHATDYSAALNIELDFLENKAPVANDLNITNIEDSGFYFHVPAYDPETQPLVASVVTQPFHGTVVVNSYYPTFLTYTPKANYSGVDSFTYKVSDGTLFSNVAIVNLTVSPQNDNPVPVPDYIRLFTDNTPVTFNPLINDLEFDNDPLQITSVTSGFYGSSVYSANSITYTPSQFSQFQEILTYFVSDGNGGSSYSSIILTRNKLPVANNDSVLTSENTPINFNPITNSDTDADNDPLTIISVTNGTLGSVSIAPNNRLIYTPNPNVSGADVITYTISDGWAGTAVGTVNITIGSANHSPIANTDFITTNEDTQVNIFPVANDTDSDNDTLTITALFPNLNNPKGAISIVPNTNTVVYTPNPNKNGSDSFSYQISDGKGGSAIGTVNVTINSIVDLPTIADFNTAIRQDLALQTIVNLNAIITNVDNLVVSVQILNTPVNGVASITNNTLYFSPNIGYIGAETIELGLFYNGNQVDTCQIALSTLATNFRPILNDNQINVFIGQIFEGKINAYDSNITDNMHYSVSVPATRGHFEFTNSLAGNFTYESYSSEPEGTDTVTVRVFDGEYYDTAKITINLIDGTIVTSCDPIFNDAVNTKLNRPLNTPVLRQDLALINGSFNLSGLGLSNVDCLKYLVNVKNLDLSGNSFATINLAGLLNLEVLNASNNPSLTNITGIGSLTNLTQLDVNSTAISQIDGYGNDPAFSQGLSFDFGDRDWDDDTNAFVELNKMLSFGSTLNGTMPVPTSYVTLLDVIGSTYHSYKKVNIKVMGNTEDVTIIYTTDNSTPTLTNGQVGTNSVTIPIYKTDNNAGQVVLKYRTHDSVNGYGLVKTQTYEFIKPTISTVIIPISKNMEINPESYLTKSDLKLSELPDIDYLDFIYELYDQNGFNPGLIGDYFDDFDQNETEATRHKYILCRLEDLSELGTIYVFANDEKARIFQVTGDIPRFSLDDASSWLNIGRGAEVQKIEASSSTEYFWLYLEHDIVYNVEAFVERDQPEIYPTGKNGVLSDLRKIKDSTNTLVSKPAVIDENGNVTNGGAIAQYYEEFHKDCEKHIYKGSHHLLIQQSFIESPEINGRIDFGASGVLLDVTVNSLVKILDRPVGNGYHYLNAEPNIYGYEYIKFFGLHADQTGNYKGLIDRKLKLDREGIEDPQEPQVSFLGFVHRDESEVESDISNYSFDELYTPDLYVDFKVGSNIQFDEESQPFVKHYDFIDPFVEAKVIRIKAIQSQDLVFKAINEDLNDNHIEWIEINDDLTDDVKNFVFQNICEEGPKVTFTPLFSLINSTDNSLYAPDGVPNYADGHSEFSMTGSSESLPFTPLLMPLPLFRFLEDRVDLSYDIQYTEASLDIIAGGIPKFVIAEQGFRLWFDKNGYESRSVPGDLLPPNNYSFEALKSDDSTLKQIYYEPIFNGNFKTDSIKIDILHRNRPLFSNYTSTEFQDLDPDAPHKTVSHLKVVNIKAGTEEEEFDYLRSGQITKLDDLWFNSYRPLPSQKVIKKRSGNLAEPVIIITSNASLLGVISPINGELGSNTWGFKAGIDDYDDKAYDLEWDFGDGVITEKGDITQISHTYTTPGQYVVKMQLYRKVGTIHEPVNKAEIHFISVIQNSWDNIIENQLVTQAASNELPKNKLYTEVRFMPGPLLVKIDNIYSVPYGEDVPVDKPRARVSIDKYPQNEYWVGEEDNIDLPQYLYINEGDNARKQFWLDGYKDETGLAYDIELKLSIRAGGYYNWIEVQNKEYIKTLNPALPAVNGVPYFYDPVGSPGTPNGPIPTKWFVVEPDVLLHNLAFNIKQNIVTVPGRKLNLSIDITYRGIDTPTVSRSLGKGWYPSWEEKFVKFNTKVIEDDEEVLRLGGFEYFEGNGRVSRFLIDPGTQELQISAGHAFKIEYDDEEITLTYADSTKAKFARYGEEYLLKSIEDRFGNKIEQEIQSGKVIKIKDDIGNVFSINYDDFSYIDLEGENKEENRVANIIDHLGRLYEFDYTGEEGVYLVRTRIENDVGEKIGYNYDDKDRLTDLLYDGILWAKVKYNDANLELKYAEVQKITWASLLSEEFTRAKSIVTVEDVNKITHQYKFTGNLLKEILVIGNETQTLNLKTQLSYSSNGYIGKIIYPMGNEESYTYRGASNGTNDFRGADLITEHSLSPGVRELANGGLGANSTASLVTRTTYHGESYHYQPISTKAMDGTVTKYFYDAPMLSLTKIVETSQDGNDVNTLFAYNEFGQLTKTLTPDKSLIINKYFESTGSGGAVKGYLSHTIRGVRNTNSAEGGFSLENSDADMTTDDTDETNNKKITTSYKYNQYGNIEEIENGKGGVEIFEYDTWQRMFKYHSPTINGANSVKVVEDISYYNNHFPQNINTHNPVANGENSYNIVTTSSHFVYDSIGRILSETTSVQGDTGLTSYFYESGKKLLKSIKYPNNGHKNFKYDSIGRAIVVVENDDDNIVDNTFGQPTYASFVEYNDNSEVIKTDYIPTPFMTLTSISTGVKEPETEISRDWLGREAITKVFPDNTTTEMAWDDNGQNKFVTSRNSQGAVVASRNFTYRNGYLEKMVSTPKVSILHFNENPRTARSTIKVEPHTGAKEEYTKVFDGLGRMAKTIAVFKEEGEDEQRIVSESKFDNNGNEVSRTSAATEENIAGQSINSPKLRFSKNNKLVEIHRPEFDVSASEKTVVTLQPSGLGDEGFVKDEIGVATLKMLDEANDTKEVIEDFGGPDARSTTYTANRNEKTSEISRTENANTQSIKTTEDTAGNPLKVDTTYQLDSTVVAFEETFNYDELNRLNEYKRKDNSKLVYEYFGRGVETVANNRGKLRFIKNEAGGILRQYDAYNDFNKPEIIREFYNPPNEFDFVEIIRVYQTAENPGYSHLAFETTQIFGSKSSPAYTIGYEYNTNGTIKKINYPEETASLNLNYAYGSLLKKITKTNGGGDQVLIEKEIDPNHLVCTEYKLYGLNDKPFVNVYKSTRDSIIEAISFNGNFLSTFFYDQRGLKVRTGQWVDSSSNYNRSYTYDKVKRLVRAEPDSAQVLNSTPADKFQLETFAFDKFDYISSSQMDGITQTYTKRGFRNQYYSYVSENKTKKFKYDDRGNLVEDVNFIYEWDDFDRLKSARKKVNDFIKTPLPEVASFTEETVNSSKVFTQNWVYGTGIHSVKLEGLNNMLTKSQISLELLNEQSNFVPVEFIVESSTGNDLELLINFTNSDFSSRGARVTIADTTVTLSNIDGLITHPPFEIKGGVVEVQDSQSVTANFISLNQLDEIVVDIPLNKFNSNAIVEIDTGSGFVSVPFAFGIKSTDLFDQTTLVVFEQSGVNKIRISLDNPMDAVTVFQVRTFGNAELPERVDYMYDASNRRVARLFTGVANLSIERAIYDGLKVIEERQYTTGQLQRRYYHGDGDNRIIAVEEDTGSNGVVDDATDNVYIPLLDDRGTLMGVANKTGVIIEKLYYNSTGLVKSYIWDGSSYVEAVDTNGKNIGRSLFIRSGWTGLYHEPFTQKYHALFRDYDPQHQRWLSEDPAGVVDGMNLYHAYMGVNGIDPLGLFDTFEFLHSAGKAVAEPFLISWDAINLSIDIDGNVILLSMTAKSSKQLLDSGYSAKEVSLSIGKEMAWYVGTLGIKHAIEFNVNNYMDVVEGNISIEEADRRASDFAGSIFGSMAMMKLGQKSKFDPELTGNINGITKGGGNKSSVLMSEYIKMEKLKKIRTAYNNHFDKWGVYAKNMLNKGVSAEHVAKRLHNVRRLAGIRYKAMTPFYERMKIYYRNIAPRWFPKVRIAKGWEKPKGYDSIYGPSVNWFRKAGFSWEEIIEKSLRSSKSINERLK